MSVTSGELSCRFMVLILQSKPTQGVHSEPEAARVRKQITERADAFEAV
jgi:hypothetical protein